MKLSAFSVLLSSLFVASALFAQLTAGSPGIPPDPDDAVDLPDPCSVYHNGVYYQYGGQNVISSSDLVHWSRPKVYWEGAPTWSTGYPPGGPTVIQKSSTNQWFVYYNVPHKNCHSQNTICQCVGVSIASSPAGPFKVVPNIDPLVCDEDYDYVVDPCVRNINGQWVLYWKSTFASTSKTGPSALWVANISADGLSLSSSPVQLMASEMHNWEIGTMEGPSTVFWKNKWRLFYSGNAWTSANYALGYGDCDTPWGPCKKVTTTNPWLGSYNKTRGPGGQEFFVDDSGEAWVIMHGWEEGHVGYNNGGQRAPRVYPLYYLEQKFGALT